jgi:DNA-binding LacI/PurR family transcriptional regulator
MGRKAAEMAFQLVDGRTIAELPSAVVKPTLVLGQTT